MSDQINRQESIYALKAMAVPLYKDPECNDIWERDRTLNNAIDVIRGLPSAEPEQKIGQWIKMSDADGIYYCCSECGEELYREWSFDRDYDLFPRKKTIDKTNFCPNCGAKMDEVER